MQENEDTSGLYVDIVALINKLADYVIPDDNPAKERLGEIMGRTDFETEIGKLERRGACIGNLCSGARCSIDTRIAAARLNLDIDELKKRMSHNGYRYPES